MTAIQPNINCFSTFDSIITRFYYKNKPPQIKLTTLQKGKSHRGLEVLRFQHYYLAHQLQCIIKWIYKDQYQNPWLEIEQSECRDIDIKDLPLLSKTIKNTRYKNLVISMTQELIQTYGTSRDHFLLYIQIIKNKDLHFFYSQNWLQYQTPRNGSQEYINSCLQ